MEKWCRRRSIGGWRHRREGDEQGGADYIAELAMSNGIRSVDAMAGVSGLGPILLSLKCRKAYEV